MLSSPMACLETVNNRLKKLEKSEEKKFRADWQELQQLKSALEEITPDSFAKYQQLLQLIKSKKNGGFNWNGKDAKDRLVIFTKRLVTMSFLQENLQRDLKLEKQ